MAKIDIEFYRLCNQILTHGLEYENKNRGVKRLQIPSYTLRHEMADGFPALSLKKLPFKIVAGELIWFLRGDNDIKWLNEQGITIWNKDAYNWYCKAANKLIDGYKLSLEAGWPKIKNAKSKPVTHSKQLSEIELIFDNNGDARIFTFEEFSAKGVGSVGQNYSAQWRNFNGKTDQIFDLIKGMQADIMSSRLKVNAWNPSEVDETALPPCHSEFQVIGVPLSFTHRLEYAKSKLLINSTDNTITPVDEARLDALYVPRFGFELHWNQRSVDVFLGLPFNIASYGLLAKILEQLTGYPALAIEGTLKCVHFYDNQYEAANEIVKRSPYKNPNCKLVINPDILIKFPYLITRNPHHLNDYFNQLQPLDFKLVGYEFDEEIKVAMLAPKQ